MMIYKFLVSMGLKPLKTKLKNVRDNSIEKIKKEYK